MLRLYPRIDTVIGNLLFKLLSENLESSVQVIAWLSSVINPNSLAIATAVSRWSPVIMIGLIPAWRHWCIAAVTSGRTGSIIPVRPIKVESCSRLSGERSAGNWAHSFRRPQNPQRFVGHSLFSSKMRALCSSVKEARPHSSRSFALLQQLIGRPFRILNPTGRSPAGESSTSFWWSQRGPLPPVALLFQAPLSPFPGLKHTAPEHFRSVRPRLAVLFRQVSIITQGYRDRQLLLRAKSIDNRHFILELNMVYRNR